MSEGAKAKAWLHERIEELSDERVDEVWEIWQAPRDAEPPTHYADGEPVPGWVLAVREVVLRREVDTSVEAILARHGETRLSPAEFERHFGDLPSDGEG